MALLTVALAAAGVGSASQTAIAQASSQDGETSTADAEGQVRAAVASLSLNNRTFSEALRSQCSVYESGAKMELAYACARDLVRATRSWAPQSVELVCDLLRLSRNALRLARLDVASSSITEAAKLVKSLPPGLSVHVDLEMAQGNLLAVQGNWRMAQLAYERARVELERSEPDSLRMAGAKVNLGLVALNLGDLDAARIALLEAQQLQERNEAPWADRASALHTLGQVDWVRGELEEAGSNFEKAASLEREANPASPMLATTLLALAAVHARLGHNDLATSAYLEALRIIEGSDCACLAPALNDIGGIQLGLGQLDAANVNFGRARDIFRSTAPDSPLLAETLRGLARVALERSEWKSAQSALAEALGIEQRNSKNTASLAITLFLLGQLAQSQQDSGAARDFYCRSTEVLDRVRLPFADSNYSQATFRAQFEFVYGSCLRAEMRDGRLEAAFSTLERMRARGFLNALQERDISLQEVPQRKLNARRVGNAQVGNLAAAQGTLEPGTLALSFDVGDHDTVVFAVSRNGTRVETIAIGHEELRARITKFRSSIEAGSVEAVRREADQLYRILLGPFESQLAIASEVLISPDGPLHELAFAALWNEQRHQWLVERLPIAMFDSFSSRVATNATHRGGSRQTLAVVEPSIEVSDVRLRDSHWIQDLAPLPGARAEVAALVRHFGDSTRILAQGAATEAKVKASLPSAKTIHFAVHGFFDGARPSQSALVLSGEPAHGKEDGLLRVYEVFGLRLKADLVVLSGCDTARGEFFGGEGLLNFSRAFHFAGAKSVVASLWSVQDAATAKLMERFYEDAGVVAEPAQALRHAMITVMHDSSVRLQADKRGIGAVVSASGLPRGLEHPYYWASFVVYDG